MKQCSSCRGLFHEESLHDGPWGLKEICPRCLVHLDPGHKHIKMKARHHDKSIHESSSERTTG